MSGHYTQGKPYYSGHTWRRVDTYHSKYPDLDGCHDNLFADGKDDDSPIFAGAYDGKCSCCWLGFAHTTNAHNARKP